MCVSIPVSRLACVCALFSWICFSGNASGAVLHAATVAPHSSNAILSAESSSSQTNQQAARAWDFTESVGVDTHFAYTDTAYYQKPATIIGDIQALHIRHIRDGLQAGWIAPNLYSIFGQLAHAGIHVDLILPSPSNEQQVSALEIESLLPNYPSVERIEGPNEFDQAGGFSWATGLRSFLPVVWQVGRDTGLPVLGPSLTQPGSYPTLGDVSRFMDYGNMHVYWGGRNPETGGWGPPDLKYNYYGSLPYNIDEIGEDSPNKPSYVTETGYVVNNHPSINVVPEWVEAVYEPRLLLHLWNSGVKRTYIYELMDDPSSPVGFGLLRHDLSPRPAYTAIKTLMGLLADKDSAFTPEALPYTISGNISGIETTLLQKQDGTFWLALWQPGCIFDVNAVKSTPLPAHNITLMLDNNDNVLHQWSFDQNGNATMTSPNSSSINLSIKGTVTLLEIGQP
jgi:hypothetical protein